MSIVSLLTEISNERAGFVPLTVDQYHRMIKEGILEEGAPIELLDGVLVRKDRSKKGANPMTVGTSHAWVIGTLPLVLADVTRYDCHLRMQLPIEIPPINEPEPDASIAFGDPGRYRYRHPSPADLACCIEVSESSLNRDRTTKRRIYADAGIAQYIIINLIDSVVEQCLEPVVGEGKYGSIRTSTKADTLAVKLGESNFEVPVDRLLT